MQAEVEWVLDTWVLVKAGDIDFEGWWDAVDLLDEISRRHRLALDTERSIDAEYLRNIKPRTIVARWWTDIQRRTGRTVRYSSTPHKRDSSHLLNRLHFDSSDLKFVAVASKTSSRLLVAEESDYTEEVKNYLLLAMKTRVLTLAEARNLARNP